MANTTNFSVRIDSEVKKQSETLFGELGMNLTTAINVFLRQSIRVGGIPFDLTVKVPSAVTLAAMQESVSCEQAGIIAESYDFEEKAK